MEPFGSSNSVAHFKKNQSYDIGALYLTELKIKLKNHKHNSYNIILKYVLWQ